MKPYRLASIVVLLVACGPAGAQTTFYGPTAYLSQADSPFAASILAGTTTLATFETAGLPVGVTASAGAVLNPGSLTDSVDADDGAIDGFGRDGHDWFSGAGSTGVTFTFNSAILGGLPTHAGIVWTDGGGTITFEAFDASNVSLGTVTGTHANGINSGETSDDRFYGIAHSGGISKIKIKNASGGIEMDHLQFGPTSGGAVPEPSALALFAATCLPLCRLLKRRR